MSRALCSSITRRSASEIVPAGLRPSAEVHRSPDPVPFRPSAAYSASGSRNFSLV